MGLGEAGKKKVTFIVENCNAGSYCCKSFESIFTTDRTVFPDHLQLLQSPPSTAYAWEPLSQGFYTGTKESKILLCASSSELLFQEPFLLFS